MIILKSSGTLREEITLIKLDELVTIFHQCLLIFELGHKQLALLPVAVSSTSQQLLFEFPGF